MRFYTTNRLESKDMKASLPAFRFTILELAGLIAVAAVTAAFGKSALAADSLEEILTVFVMIGVAVAVCIGILIAWRLLRR